MKNNTNITKAVTQQFLDWVYSKAIDGFTGVDSAYILGNNYLEGKGNLDEKVNSLIRWQMAKAGASGLITGFGGLVTIPFTIPLNVASIIYIQVRMIAAIAYMGGYDIRDDKVKTMIYVAMAGNSAKELLKDVSIKAGERVLTRAVTNASVKTLDSVNQRIGYKLLSKLGIKSKSQLSKAIPIMGGLISGTYDAASTKIVGTMAKKIFINKNSDEIEIIEIESEAGK